MKAPIKISSLAEFVDIYPTLLDLADLQKPKYLQARSLVLLLKGHSENWKDAVLSQHGIADAVIMDKYTYLACTIKIIILKLRCCMIIPRTLKKI